MGFIDTFNVSFNGQFYFATVRRGERAPTIHTLTVSSAAAADASALNLTCNPAMRLQHDAILRFDRVAPGFTVNNAAGYPQGANRMTVAPITGVAAIAAGSKFIFDDPLHTQVYTVAEDVAAAGTSLGFTPSLRLSVSQGDVIKPQVECKVIIPNDPNGRPSDVVDIGSTDTQVRVTQLTGAIAQNSTCQVYESRKLLGLVNFSPSSEMPTSQIFDHETQGKGFIGSYTTGASSPSLAITGNIRDKDRGYELLNLLVNDPIYDGLLCWGQSFHSNGQYSEGYGYFTSLSLGDQTPDPTTYTTAFAYASNYLSYNTRNYDLYAAA